ncbi:uncharacterized protein KD926_002152 [Aspergillus affinis]|uniref:uncharacterized protein n=1 Tax=Aspergillus affinis TaxID=1070780 RepID=UPI0022FDDD39|nr:uncharacterized protein KD926_002152 [Aspergillus affinis]KAI9036243.1 hypothetical protein KD926_002152 [Aspergillus affinis]
MAPRVPILCDRLFEIHIHQPERLPARRLYPCSHPLPRNGYIPEFLPRRLSEDRGSPNSCSLHRLVDPGDRLRLAREVVLTVLGRIASPARHAEHEIGRESDESVRRSDCCDSVNYLRSAIGNPPNDVKWMEIINYTGFVRAAARAELPRYDFDGREYERLDSEQGDDIGDGYFISRAVMRLTRSGAIERG